MSREIRADEWLDELEQVLSHRVNDKGLTTEELCERTGKSRIRVGYMLRAMHRQGRILVGRRTCQRMDGVPFHKPVYVIRSRGSRNK